jgi:calcineurin-like phosphoesterase family protein
MGKIYLTSDLHFGHEREFLYGPRNFASIQEHDEAVIERWNSLIQEDDDVYVLGDLMLNDNEHGLDCLRRLNGRLHLVRGNHDSDVRWAMYMALPNVVEMNNVIIMKYRKYHFYLSHFPTLTANLEKESLHQCTINLFGHTHQKTNFYQDMPFMYHVGLDSHDCYPVLLDDAIEEMKAKVKECVDML